MATKKSLGQQEIQWFRCQSSLLCCIRPVWFPRSSKARASSLFKKEKKVHLMHQMLEATFMSMDELRPPDDIAWHGVDFLEEKDYNEPAMRSRSSNQRIWGEIRRRLTFTRQMLYSDIRSTSLWRRTLDMLTYSFLRLNPCYLL